MYVNRMKSMMQIERCKVDGGKNDDEEEEVVIATFFFSFTKMIVCK